MSVETALVELVVDIVRAAIKSRAPIAEARRLARLRARAIVFELEAEAALKAAAKFR